MKTKQMKEEVEKNADEESVVEPKKRGRKKATDVNEDDKSKPNQDEPKTSKEPKKNIKPRAIIKKKPLGIRKALRSKKGAIGNEKLKNVIKKTVKRGRKPAIKPDPENSQEKDTVLLIPASEIKKEPIDDTSPTSRSASPKTAGRRQRLSSDMVMLKTVLSDSPNNLVTTPRTSPYSMRSERSNSPSSFEGKNLRSGKPRKVKNNLLNEVVLKEQKKRRRLLSESKTSSDGLDLSEECKKLKRGRSCSRDGSEISKCSDITESDISLSETLNDSESKELSKKNDSKPKTDLDIDIENNVQISTIDKVPSPNVDSRLAELKSLSEPAIKTKKKLSLKRSTSLDSDNNNSNRLKLEKLHADIEDNLLLKTEHDTLELSDRSNILTSMAKTFNSKEMSKNIRKARRGRKAAAAARPNPNLVVKNGISSTVTQETSDEKHETLETLSKEIDDLINNLDQNIDRDKDLVHDSNSCPTDQMQTKTVSKFYGLSKPLGDNNSINAPETPVKDVTPPSFETPSKMSDSENIKLHYEEDSIDKSSDGAKQEITYKCSTVASIDKLMDRLKEFEEFDKRRQRQESESKTVDKPMMVTNDVVLIPKSGADIKPLKDMQPAKSPEKPIEKENVLSCFENNSAISIVKRDQARKSIDIDLPNSVTLIKRNSVNSRKESTSSNHSRESDAISIFEKSLGKDVTLTEIRKSVDKPITSPPVEIHQFATLHPNNPAQKLDSNEISITPRIMTDSKLSSEVQLTKRNSLESLSRKSSESSNGPEEKLATLEKIKSPPHQMISPAVSITPAPVAIKSPKATQPMEIEALEPPLEDMKMLPEGIHCATEVPQIETEVAKEKEMVGKAVAITPETSLIPISKDENESKVEKDKNDNQMEEDKKCKSTAVDTVPEDTEKATEVTKNKVDTSESAKSEGAEVAKPGKSPGKKSARNSTESVPGPSNVLQETPESQQRKENVLRTLGLLTHKAAKEAKIEKQKEKERIYSSLTNKSKSTKPGDYTGTLKTVIKINRGSGEGSKKRHRSSLKMTFQKSKHRGGKPVPEVGEGTAENDYYTIERKEGAAAGSDDQELAPEPVEPKETTLNLVIPEKASSFSIHPGRLCMDQCFYCGGKFGLFDTPCHIAQMKSVDRQKKVLETVEKLTIDSCLCDACFRHVDRRANCDPQRKRPPKHSLETQTSVQDPSQVEKPPSPMGGSSSGEEPLAGASCHARACCSPAARTIRRKWLIKMRGSVNKLLQLEGDYPGLHTIPLCAVHYGALAPLLQCSLCMRRIAKPHPQQGFLELNPLLREAGIPVEFKERPVLCRPCRYYCSLIKRPGLNEKDARSYRRRLLQIHNVALPPDPEPTHEQTSSLDDLNTSTNKQKKKARTKTKQSKSDTDKPDSGSDRTTESPRNKEKGDENKRQEEEDIESLISSNKIPVPGAKPSEHNNQSDGSETEMVIDPDFPLIPYDKQTELQYLLQMQNNPAQFMQKQPNLTQKQKNILKVQNITGIQKPGQQHRIIDKNAKKIQKIGQIILQKEKQLKKGIEIEMVETEKVKNIPLNDECTIESIPNKRPADINELKNKWQMSESFTQVKKNLSELSKKLTIDPKKSSDAKYSNPVRRLETNPSISVRELFPGEEEMNLQCSIEFNNVKGVTPEGWEKCSTTIQYDLETKKLWNDLQRPYGNQSSFLRHLILLEKYFRSGDLVLAQNASPHAANYSDSVQSRLRAYDNVANDAPRRSEPAISLIEYRKKPTMNGKSLLKSNQNDDKESKKVMPPPPSILPRMKQKEKSKSKQTPPDLISINTPNAQGRKAIQNVLHNIQQLVKGVSASDPTEVAAAPLPPPSFEAPKEKKDNPEVKSTKPDTEKPKKQRTTSKPWRPTLMPITKENEEKIAKEPKQVAVDGRLLRSLVQVMSSGKHYHITLQDYNKMCIMRKEKLQQIQDGEGKAKRPSLEAESIVTEIQPSAILGNGGKVTQNIPPEETPPKTKEMPELGPLGSNAANILKTVGLKNITIAPIPPKTATITSQTLSSPAVSTQSLIMTSTPIKIPQLGPSVSITSETILTPNPPIITTPMVIPKIPKSLTVIPQTILPSLPQSVVVTATGVTPSQGILQTTDGSNP